MKVLRKDLKMFNTFIRLEIICNNKRSPLSDCFIFFISPLKNFKKKNNSVSVDKRKISR